MANNTKDNNSKKMGIAVKIIIPVIIAGIIVTIAVMKNMGDNTATQSAPPAAARTEEQGAGKTPDAGNADFELLATEIDIEKLKSYGLPIIIDFGADECVPCKEMAPVLKKLNEEWQGRVIVKFVDVWKTPELAEDFPVSVIPTQVFFDAKGNPFVPSEKLMNEIPFNLYSVKDTGKHVYTSHEGGLTEEQIKTIFEEMGVAE